jgi:hypothetical protein
MNYCGKAMFPDKDGATNLADNRLISGILVRMVHRATAEHQERKDNDWRICINQDGLLIPERSSIIRATKWQRTTGIG